MCNMSPRNPILPPEFPNHRPRRRRRDARSRRVSHGFRGDARTDDGGERGVAVHVDFANKASFETSFSLHRFKGWNQGTFKLWVNWIRERVKPRRGGERHEPARDEHDVPVGVSLGVAEVKVDPFESKSLKPVISLYRPKGWNRALSKHFFTL
jgi:hypothetical protein